MTDAVIASRVAGGHFHSVFRGVFAVGHPHVSRQGRMLAALLICGDQAVLSHGTAAALLGLWDRPPVLIDVIAPDQSGRKITGICRHHVPLPLTNEVVLVDGIRSTNPSRTIIDLAGKFGRKSLREVVEKAAIMGALNVPEIEALASAGRRGSTTLQETLNAWRDHQSPLLRSVLEASLLTLIRSHGLQEPLCNRWVAVGGTRYEVDLLWPQQRLVVEADGRKYHTNPLAFERDRKRDRELASAGYRVVRLTWEQLETEADSIVATIRSLLG